MGQNTDGQLSLSSYINGCKQQRENNCQLENDRGEHVQKEEKNERKRGDVEKWRDERDRLMEKAERMIENELVCF